MESETLNDERRIYIAVQKLIDVLLEFDEDTRARMLKTVITFFGLEKSLSIEARARQSPTSKDGVPAFANREELSPKDFLFQKKPQTDVHRVACLAYYLAHYRDIAHFRTTDISKLNTEAAQIKFSNASHAVNNATRGGFLVAAPKGNKQLSAPGEKFVDHLPDYPAARKVMSELNPRRRKKTITKGAGPTSKKGETPN